MAFLAIGLGSHLFILHLGERLSKHRFKRAMLQMQPNSTDSSTPIVNCRTDAFLILHGPWTNRKKWLVEAMVKGTSTRLPVPVV
jgi:hypothetical protein